MLTVTEWRSRDALRGRESYSTNVRRWNTDRQKEIYSARKKEGISPSSALACMLRATLPYEPLCRGGICAIWAILVASQQKTAPLDSSTHTYTHNLTHSLTHSLSLTAPHLSPPVAGVTGTRGSGWRRRVEGRLRCGMAALSAAQPGITKTRRWVASLSGISLVLLHPESSHSSMAAHPSQHSACANNNIYIYIYSRVTHDGSISLVGGGISSHPCV